MKDLYEILRQKEAAMERIRKEIAALQLVAPLLADDRESPSSAGRPLSISRTLQT